MSRRDDRIKLVQLFYQMDMLNEYFIAKDLKSELNVFQNQVIDTFIENKDKIDTSISEKLKDWTIDRIAKTDLACIRLAVTEIEFIDSIPFKVSINEAIELAKVFGDDDAPKFINGLLRSFEKC